jgi:DNA-directed RNA polymerase subunit L
MSQTDSYIVPKIEFHSEANGDELRFRLSGVNVSIANALRRIVLSDIPLVVFRVSPHEKSKCVVLANTCGLNNEIVKHRLSCIPIHLKVGENVNVGDRELPLEDCIVEVDVVNNSDTAIVVTTKDFAIKSKTRDDLVVKEDILRSIFPADTLTGGFIDFVRLKARPSEEIQPKSIHLTCEFDVGMAKEDGAYNAVSVCSYGNTIDQVGQVEALQKKKQDWKDAKKDVEFEEINWKLLEGKRVYVKDSFDFVIQTACVYTNEELMVVACEIMLKRLEDLKNYTEQNKLQVNNAENLMANCFDIVLENEDYTVGKVLEYFLLSKFYEAQPKILHFCGFKMLHPHDTFSIIRVAYPDPVEKATVKGHLVECIEFAKDVFIKMHKVFVQNVDRR